MVNKIAAGEIVIAPANALKEMLENSIDAKSSSIEISVKDGGLKELTITDNGSGISKEDLPILCERFTTSKISKFEDLDSIATYGFRGEALASISHIAHLTVVTKTKNDVCAYKCHYSDGKLVPARPKESSDPRPIAGKDGTQISVADLFYNVPSRLRTLKSPSEEYSKILDVVGRYAVHTENVGFSCKKIGETFNSLTVRNGLNHKERIRSVFGSNVAKELMEIKVIPNEEYGLLKCYGYVTNSNFVNKKSISPLFFINNRLVSNDPLRRAILQIYSIYLPKGHKPFVYLSLEIDPKNVDVNVHPTKREVRFLNEEEIIEHIVNGIETELSSLDSNRTFLTQQVLSGSKRFREDNDITDTRAHKIKNTSTPKLTNISQLQQFKRVSENKLVRTDFSQQTLNSFVNNNNSSSRIDESNVVDVSGETSETEEPNIQIGSKQILGDLPLDNDSTGSANITQSNTTRNSRTRVKVKLTSILSAREKVEKRTDRELTEIFTKHTFVGIVDFTKRLMCIQYNVKLYLVDFASICYELFYQIGLSDFSNFGIINLGTPLSLKDLIYEVIDDENFSSKDKIEKSEVDEVIETLVEMSDMLEEYFSIKIESDGEAQSDPKIASLPMLLKNYVPPVSKLSLFVYKLAVQIDWSDEASCLTGILRQIALLYIPECIPDISEFEEGTEEYQELISTQTKIAADLENIILPCIKKRFLGTKNISRDVVEIANLPGLYKVFERC